MDFVDGPNAAELLSDRYPSGMPVDTVVAIITAVASALDYAHKQGLLHRDVKPANIMLTHVDDDDEQRILLADFGIARDADDISGLTSTNMAVGTVAYAAPEQLMGDDIDGRADQYALAASAYHLLTGVPLFQHSNPAVVISRHLNAPPPTLAETRSELAPLDRVLAKALAKKPEDRYPRCGDFAQALAGQDSTQLAPIATLATQPAPVLARTTPATPAPPRASKPSSVPPVRGSRRNWIVSVGAATAFLVAAAVAALAWQPWTDRDASVAAPPTKSSVSATKIPLVPVTTTPLPPPPPAVFPASRIDSVLLTPAEITSTTGGAFEGYPSGPVEVINSTLGTADNTHAIDPPSCAGVIFGAEQQVYADTGYEAIRNQILGKSVSAIDGLVEQTVAVFPTAEEAQAVLVSSTAQWRTCANGHPLEYSSDASVSHDAGYEKGWGWYLSGLVVGDELMTMYMTSVDNLNGNAPACQLALGVRENAVVKVKTCLDTGTNPQLPDPSLSGDYAERLAIVMLDRIVT